MPHAHRLYVPSSLALALSAALLLTACGGGGDSPVVAAPLAVPPAVASPASAASAAAVAPVIPVIPVIPVAPPNMLATLSGVAAFGAPLSGATLKVIDAKGRAVGTGTTNQADGSYTLALALGGAAPTMPLLVQAAGFDATGLPMLLHSAVPAVSGTATSVVLNITPLTDAAVALTLGAEPRKVFAQPANYTTQLAALATLSPASDFVKNLVKTNLTDAKVASTTTLDLFADSSFTATKVGVDLALETLSISYGVSSTAARRDLLQLGNKLGARPVEVTVDLATAATELAKPIGAAPATAITSTLKLTTSPTTVVARLPALDTLAVAINTAVAAGGGGSAVTALASSYVRHNGRDAAALTALIAGWAQQGTQLGRLQVTGCADLPSTSTTTTPSTIVATCTKVAVAARLTDTAGNQTGSFSDVVTYSTSGSKWSLVGNGLPAAVSARATAWLSLNADGGKTSGAVGNPRTGIQLGVQNNTTGVGVASATVLTPSNYVLTLVQCAQTWLCISPTAGATSTVATATPGDQSVFQGTSVWMGVADTAVGATYSFTLTPTTPTTGSNTTITLPVSLRNGFLDAPADARFPVLDGIKSDAPLSGATLLFGTTLSWQAWAAANPDMRVTTVRLVLGNENNAGNTTGSVATPLVFDARPARWQASSLEWAAVAVPQDFALGSVTLWLLAVDSSGREVATGYVVLTP